jgi:K+-sensing histidine kinase KdpD
MAHFVTDRIVVGLQRTAAILAILAGLVVVAGIGWTASADALLTAVLIATLAFGLPAIALFALAYWLDVQATKLEGRRRDELVRRRDDAATHPFREPTFGYVIAVVAALVAWGLRMVIDPYLPGSVPFITYFIAVAVSGWVGGYGPAVLTTALCACIARYFYMTPAFSFQLLNPVDAVRLGSFVFVCLCIGGLTAALHSALRRVQTLDNQLKALTSGNATRTTAAVAAPARPQSCDLVPHTAPPPAPLD